jgi:hypothetical protein
MVDRERETIVHTEGGRSGGSALAVVAAILVLLVVLFLFFGRGMLDGGGGTEKIDANVDVNLPSGGDSGGN